MSVIYIIVAEPTLIINDVADLHKWIIASYGHYGCDLRTSSYTGLFVPRSRLYFAASAIFSVKGTAYLKFQL